jgi:hypothetical protein
MELDGKLRGRIIMDLERKIKLMERYDIHGFVGSLKDMDSCLSLCSRPSYSLDRRKEDIDALKKDYQFLEEGYSKIDFDGLEKEIGVGDREDFATLFEVRKLLPKFKIAVEEYCRVAETNSYLVPKDHEAAQKVRNMIYNKLMKADHYNGISYRSRIVKLKRQLNPNISIDF